MSTILPYLPRRLTLAREKAGLTQAELCHKVGFKDRQTLAAIESGFRQITAEELVAISEATGHELEFFTDPFRLAGEGAFSYRASGTTASALVAFEEKAGRWLALWRHLGACRQESPSPLRRRLALTIESTYEEAQLVGEAVRRELELGPVPAKLLVRAMEEVFQLLVLEVDMPNGVSGAAVRLNSGEAILINQAESPGRKAFDLAHELFHVLTWEALPPERVDRAKPTGYKQKRTEQLADNFAAALLMPEEELRPRWEKRGSASLAETVESLAGHFQVSTAAVGWRLVALRWIKKDAVPTTAAQTMGKGPATPTPRLFSKRFIDRVAWGIDRGELSVRRALELLDLDLAGLRQACQASGVKLSVGL